MRNFTVKFLSAVFTVAVVLSILTSSIYMVCIDRGVYRKAYVNNNTSSYTNMSNDDLNKVTDNLLNYLSGKRDSLDMTATINGEEKEVFDEREKAHMIDVKILFNTLMGTVVLSFLVAVICFYSVRFIQKKRYQQVIASMFLKTSVILYTLVFILISAVFINFDWFWTTFHQIIFTNDLWLLDPDVSVMINMFPLEFFFSMCTRIIFIFLACVFCATFLAYTNSKKKVK